MSTVKTVVYYSKCHLKKKKIGTIVREKFDDLIEKYQKTFKFNESIFSVHPYF